MIAAANILTELFLSLVALAGLSVLHVMLTAQDAFDPLNRRFLFGVRVTMVLFAGRVLVILTGGEWFRAIVLLAAALIPLAVLILTEGLLRRHAPAWAKAYVGGGAIVLGVAAFLPEDWIAEIRLWSLLIFQLSGLLLSGWLVLRRNRSSLSGAENQTVTRMALSLVVLIPLVLVDFLMDRIGLPVQLSSIGVLALCWLAIGLSGPIGGHRSTVTGFAVMVASATCAASIWAVISASGWHGFVTAWAIVLAAILLVMILQEARQIRLANRSMSLLRHLARGPGDDAMTFLSGLRAHPAVEGAVVVEEPALADLDADVLDRIFQVEPVLRRSSPPALDAIGSDHVAHLFERYAASHILQITKSPRRLIVLSMPSLGTSPQEELELEVVQRMAALIAGQGHD